MNMIRSGSELEEENVDGESKEMESLTDQEVIEVSNSKNEEEIIE